MKIGMMADVYKPHISGVTNYIALNKQVLESQGHQVFVFTFQAGDYQDDESNIVRSPSVPLLDTGFHFSLRYDRRARHLLRSMDVVHVHHPFLSGSLALLYCRPFGIPIIFTNHTRYDLYARSYMRGGSDELGQAAIQAYLPTFCRAVNLVICPSPGIYKVLQSFGIQDEYLEIVPNGVDLQRFQELPASMERTQLGFSEEDVVLIYIGRLGPEKNLYFLLRSFAGAAQAYEHIRLVLIGDGPERSSLEERVERSGLSERVHFLGSVAYDRVPCYLAMADAFVTASVTEVHPLTVIEAMASGLPVLGIDSPGVGDTVRDGETGYLAPEEDLAMFTAKMIKLATQHEQRNQMGENARQTSHLYDIRRTSQMMLERYQWVVDQSAARRRGWRVRLDRWLDQFRA
jgi:glycosyltransferase involved in cell wall biosynthesis